MRIDIVTLFPEVALAPLSDSIIQRARAAGMVEVVGHQLRDWSRGQTPAGGRLAVRRRAGDVAETRAAVCRRRGAARAAHTRVILMTPQGKPFKQAVARELATVEAPA